MEEDKTQEAVPRLTNYMSIHGGHSDVNSSNAGNVFYYIIIIINISIRIYYMYIYIYIY